MDSSPQQKTPSFAPVAPERSTQPTPYPEINALLDCLLAEVQAVLGEQFVGLYLHGSLAAGAFAPRRSDIDVVVVTAGELDGETLVDLEAMHARITATGGEWATRLEGSYIPREAIRRYDPDHAWHPALRVDGTFAIDGHGIDWVIQSHVLREQGIALAGPDPKVLIDPVSADDLRQAARGTLEEWWRPQLDDPHRLFSDEYRAYAVLTMCRALYTLETGRVALKRDAARWAQAALDARRAPLIQGALAWPEGPPSIGLEETLDLIRHTLERSASFPMVRSL